MPKRAQKKELWFRAKKYGWGWYPNTKEGWEVLLLFIFAMIFNLLRLQLQSSSDSEFLMTFIPETFFLVILLIIICFLNGEKPHWSWGENQKSKKK